MKRMHEFGKGSLRRGFTLIELMITVVIIGILASLAIYSVRNYITKSKTVEAREIVGKIMAAQEDYFVETQRYLDVTGGFTNGATDFYPSDSKFDGMKKIMWGDEDDSCVAAGDTGNGLKCGKNFKTLGVMVNQPVMYRYACTTYEAGDEVKAGPKAPGFNNGSVKAPRDGYVVVAVSALGGEGSTFSVLAGSAMQADLYSANLAP